MWRDKLLAFGVHFIATALLAAVAASLIFLIWFPAPFDDMLGGTELFELVVGCDLALGPLLSLVIFNRNKTRRELVTDYTIVAIVQISALAYGVWVMAASRPVYVAFYKDRFEIVMPQNIRGEDLAAARGTPYASLPISGPELVGVRVPARQEGDLMFEELAGHGGQAQPRFYVPYGDVLEEVRKHGGELADLEKRHPEKKADIAAAVAASGMPEARLRWLPVAARGLFWTAFVDHETGKPLAYAPVDPY